MKRITLALIVTLLTASVVFAGGSKAYEADREAVTQVVLDAYVNGVHAAPNPDAMRAGFHPSFAIFGLRDGELTRLPLDKWVGYVEKAAANPADERPMIDHKFSIVDVARDAAMVRVEIFKDGAHVYSDYLSLYRFPDGWKIVGKIYHRYP